jgi:signal transduction histidine kinase
MSDKNTYKSVKPDKFYYICNSINELTHQNCIIMLGRLGYFFICFLWLLQSSKVLAVSNDKKPILIICSYNPAAHQTSVTISDYMDEYSKLGGQRDIIIENMNCKSFSEAPLWSKMMTQILAKYQGEKHPAQIILLGQEAWAAYLSQRDEMQVKVPVMCSLASSNVVILPEDTVESLDSWMPESVDLFDDHLNIPELKSGFINQYDIEGNIQMIQAFYPKTKHIAFISDNTYGGVTMQALVRKEMKKFPDLDLILMDGRKHSIYTIVEELRQLPENTVILVGTWRVDMNEGYLMRNATYAMMEVTPTIPTFTPSSVSLGHWAIGGVLPDYRKVGGEMAMESVRMDTHPQDTAKHLSVIGCKAVLDSRKVKEWGLDPAVLPFKVQLVNQPVSFYQQYTYQIWSACALFVILVLGLCISLFYYFRTKRLKDELLKSEKDLRVAKDRAEESNRLKSAFLANMSHEIRTPLNSIVGFSDVLAVGGSTEEEQQSYYQIIKTNSDLLLRLINDILDLSRLEANRVTLTWEECDVVQLCSQVVASVSFSRQSSENQFLFTTSFESFRMVTDVQRMQQVMINLLSNANKFTKRGKITLDFSVNEETQMAVFSVTDTGCGIPKEKQGLVFERFEKLNEYAQGTGLGLSICKLIVHKWKGSIWIDPDYTGGARFVFSHPLNLNIEKE